MSMLQAQHPGGHSLSTSSLAPFEARKHGSPNRVPGSPKMSHAAIDSLDGEDCNRAGNKALRELDYEGAVIWYSKGLNQSSDTRLRSILLSNRSSGLVLLCEGDPVCKCT